MRVRYFSGWLSVGLYFPSILARLGLRIALAITVVFTVTHLASARDLYVVKGNPGAVAPYASWETAASDIQTAVDAAAEGGEVWVRSTVAWPMTAPRTYRSVGDTVWVRAGVYNTGGRSDVFVNGYNSRAKLPNRVAIDKAIVVRSEYNDPAHTIIQGAWSLDGRTNGPGAVRCAYVASGAVLMGFTLTGGATLSTNEAWASSSDRSGGGVYAQSSHATISNCILIANAAEGDPRNSARGGGGACQGTFFHCVFANNTTPFRGGGADHSVLFDCVVTNNSAAYGGGGVHGGSLTDCVVSQNVTAGDGGGTFGWSVANPCRVYGSVIADNRAGHNGGGAGPNTVLERCQLAGNTAGNRGGGAAGAKLTACDVFQNQCLEGDGWGGGTFGGALLDCRVVGNTARVGGGLWGGSCTNGLIVGNEAVDAGGAFGVALQACTLTGNSASHVAGGLACYGPLVVADSIVYGNQAPEDPNWRGRELVFLRSCTWPMPSEASVDTRTNAPLFRAAGSGYGTNHVSGDYRLDPRSPCAHAGAHLDGNVFLGFELNPTKKEN